MRTSNQSKSRKSFVILAAVALLVCSPALASAQYQVPGLGNATGSRLSVAEAREAARLHDAARSEVGISQKIVWSNEIAAFAQAWADHLASTGVMQHRPRQGLNAQKYGENIFRGSAGFHTSKDAVKAWASEKSLYNGEVMNGTNYLTFGHYTQMVWENTKRIGIGKAVDRNGRVFIVANYDPPGNFQGQRPFTQRSTVVVQKPKREELKPPVVNDKPRTETKPQGQRTGQLFAGVLNQNSPMNGGRRYAQHRVKLDAGRTYTLELNGSFDTWLMLFKTDGTPLANNDDISQTNRNSRLMFTPQITGQYAVVVTSYGKGETGSYTLTVK